MQNIFIKELFDASNVNKVSSLEFTSLDEAILALCWLPHIWGILSNLPDTETALVYNNHKMDIIKIILK